MQTNDELELEMDSKMKLSNWTLCIGTTAVLLMVGCAETPIETPVATAEADVLVDQEPADAKSIGFVHEESQDGDEVTVVGRIGGSRSPFVDGLAAFTLIDMEIPHCPESEGCHTPWDYCCTQNQLPGHQATIKIYDDAGKPIPLNAKDYLGVTELSVVVVKGKAQRDDAGNLSVDAREIYIKEM